jgi:hypothetical protein
MNCDVSCAFCARVIAALAPESAAPRMQEGPPCATCAHPQGWHEPDPDTGEGPLECSPPDCSVCPCLDFAAPRVEPRRPQADDVVEVYSFASWRRAVVIGRGNLGDVKGFEWVEHHGSRRGWHGFISESWRWPAAQGAAVAGPAPGCPTCGQLCPLVVGGHYVCTRPLPHTHPPEEVLASLQALSPPPPASEPPPTPEEAAFLRGASLSVTKMAEQVRLLRVDLATATAAKAALEVQLADTQEALANMTEERDMQQFHARDVAAERDALAAQLKAAWEVIDAAWPECGVCCKPATCLGEYETSTGVDSPACDACCSHGNEDGHCRPIDARAALAASGPGKGQG